MGASRGKKSETQHIRTYTIFGNDKLWIAELVAFARVDCLDAVEASTVRGKDQCFPRGLNEPFNARSQSIKHDSLLERGGSMRCLFRLIRGREKG